jgi:hypothetical protein
MSRCSYAERVRRVACVDFELGRIVLDRFIKAKKYDDFGGRYDIQIWPTLEFVENNGRGIISYGKCRVTAP